MRMLALIERGTARTTPPPPRSVRWPTIRLTNSIWFAPKVLSPEKIW